MSFLGSGRCTALGPRVPRRPRAHRGGTRRRATRARDQQREGTPGARMAATSRRDHDRGISGVPPRSRPARRPAVRTPSGWALRWRQPADAPHGPSTRGRTRTGSVRAALLELLFGRLDRTREVRSGIEQRLAGRDDLRVTIQLVRIEVLARFSHGRRPPLRRPLGHLPNLPGGAVVRRGRRPAAEPVDRSPDRTPDRSDGVLSLVGRLFQIIPKGFLSDGRH